MSTPQDRQEGEFPPRVSISVTARGDEIHGISGRFPYFGIFNYINIDEHASRLTELERKLALARGALEEIAHTAFIEGIGWVDLRQTAPRKITYRSQQVIARDALAELGADKPEPGK